jgi:hypothetical protein
VGEVVVDEPGWGVRAFVCAAETTSRPVLVNPRFFDFLLEREQLSLVILAHYGAIMALCNDTWWMDGWGQLMIRLTADLLHPTWLCKIEWPLQVLHERNAEVGTLQGAEVTIALKSLCREGLRQLIHVQIILA